jgi:endonuclease YncB( thermonuclease family)
MKLFIFFLIFLTNLESKDITGKVVEIINGDTIKVLEYLENNQKEFYKIRLNNIIAPKQHQPFNKKSKQTLSNMLKNQWVYVESSKIDKYGNYIGTVYANNLNINHEQIKRGMAWVYRKYCNDSIYYVLEEEARNNFIGLWSRPNPKPPWEYYKHNKITKPQHSKQSKKSYNYQYKTHSSSVYKHQIIKPKQSSSKYKCEGWKRYCRHMSTCEEAYFYMNECGLYRLDGDSDGVPCESICGHY